MPDRIELANGRSSILNVQYSSMDYLKELTRRKTFGIISHPDAGKTTLT